MTQTYAVPFKTYKNTMRQAIRQVLKEAPPRSLDEAAFPAYSHPNPLINWLFWKRLEDVIKVVAQNAPYEKVLDFGCGSGVLLPFLAEQSRNVVGMDIELSPYEMMKKYISFPANIQVMDGNQTSLQDLPPGSMDLIIALDVLEHVPDLSDTLDQLIRLLKPGKKLIVSVPTENVLYQIGRKIAGREFSGAYHERGAADVIQLAGQKGKFKTLSVLIPLFPFFRIFSIEKTH